MKIKTEIMSSLSIVSDFFLSDIFSNSRNFLGKAQLPLYKFNKLD